jgi:SAM-dependent methyltransferase
VNERVLPRRGAALIRNGIPYADSRTTLSLIPAAAMGEWLDEQRHLVKGTLLDLGCGHAPFRAWYEPLVDWAVRYDPAPMVDLTVRGLAEALPFADGSFDTVLATEILEHTTDAEASTREIRRVLRPGGHVLVTVPFIYPVHESPHDYRRFTHLGLADILRRNGFEVIDMSSKGRLRTLVAHWALMITVIGFGRLWRRLGGSGVLGDRRWFQRMLAAPQEVMVRRGIPRAVTGTAEWATLGYMAAGRALTPDE